MKPFKTINEQIALLQSRGLVFQDSEKYAGNRTIDIQPLMHEI